MVHSISKGKTSSMQLKNIKIMALLTFMLYINFNNVFGQAAETNTQKSVLYKAATIGNKNFGNISKQELLDANKLSLASQFDSSFQIVSFRITRVRKGENPVEIDNKINGELTVEMVEMIKILKPGDKVYFEYIKCKNSDNQITSLLSLSFVIE